MRLFASSPVSSRCSRMARCWMCWTASTPCRAAPRLQHGSAEKMRAFWSSTLSHRSSRSSGWTYTSTLRGRPDARPASPSSVPWGSPATRLAAQSDRADQVEIDLELNVVLDAEHDSNTGRRHPEVLKCDASCRLAGHLSTVHLRGHVPGHRLGDAVDRQVAGDLKAGLAGGRQRPREPGDRAWNELGGWESLGFKRVALNETVAAAAIGLQSAQVHGEFGLVPHNLAVRRQGDRAGDRIGRADRIAGE